LLAPDELLATEADGLGGTSFPLSAAPENLTSPFCSWSTRIPCTALAVDGAHQAAEEPLLGGLVSPSYQQFADSKWSTLPLISIVLSGDKPHVDRLGDYEAGYINQPNGYACTQVKLNGVSYNATVRFEWIDQHSVHIWLHAVEMYFPGRRQSFVSVNTRWLENIVQMDAPQPAAIAVRAPVEIEMNRLPFFMCFLLLVFSGTMEYRLTVVEELRDHCWCQIHTRLVQ